MIKREKIKNIFYLHVITAISKEEGTRWFVKLLQKTWFNSVFEQFITILIIPIYVEFTLFIYRVFRNKVAKFCGQYWETRFWTTLGQLSWTILAKWAIWIYFGLLWTTFGHFGLKILSPKSQYCPQSSVRNFFRTPCKMVGLVIMIEWFWIMNENC